MISDEQVHFVEEDFENDSDASVDGPKSPSIAPEHEPRRPARVRPTLDLNFFRPRHNDGTETDVNRGWDLFLDVAAQFPTLEERVAKTGCEVNIAAAAHLDDLLCQLRRWSQRHFPAGLSLREFGERVEKCSASSEFHDYRSELIRRYKTTDWKAEAAQRHQPPPLQPQDTPATSHSEEFPEPQPQTIDAANSKLTTELEDVRKRREQLLQLQRARQRASTVDEATQQKLLEVKQKRKELLEKQRLQQQNRN